MSKVRGMVPGENIKTMESNPWAPISQMAKLRLREAGDLPTPWWWRGRLSLRPLPACPWSLCGVGGGVWGLSWEGRRRWPRRCSERPWRSQGSKGEARGGVSGRRGSQREEGGGRMGG